MLQIIQLNTHLRIRGLGVNTGDCVGVSCESEDGGLGPDVPHPRSAVPPAGDEDVQAGMQSKSIHCTQVSMVLTDCLEQT